MVICLEWGADLRMAQLMPLPHTVSCFSKIQIGFTFLVPVHPGSPGHKAVKRVCVCVNFIVCCSELQMDERDKAILRANHVFLVNNLNLKHEMFKAQLIQAELLSPNDMERLEASGDFVV